MIRTRAKATSSTSKTVEFFKVYLPEFSSDQLMLPPAFIKILDKSLPHEATLQDQTGRSWLVTIEKERTLRVLVRNGWREFARHHSLEFGDFLVFNYDGNSNFSVSIFGRKGLKKNSVVATHSLSHPVKEEPENLLNESKPNPRSRNGLKKNSGVVADSFGIPVEEEPDIEPENVPEKPIPDWHGRDGSKKNSSVATNGFGIPVKEKAYEEPENLPRKSRQDQRDSDSVPRKTKKLKGWSQAQPLEITWVPVTPKNPLFERKITPCMKYRMDIRKSFLKTHGIQLEQDVELYDQSGKKWPMKVYSMHQRTSFSRGWSEFRKSHKLGTKNSCLFEFILGSGNKCKEVHVKISGGGYKSQVKN